MDKLKFNPEEIPVAVVGLGLMGCSIATCLLMSGHSVVAVASIPDDISRGEPRIRNHLEMSFKEDLTSKTPNELLRQINITENYSELKGVRLVVESIVENLEIKKNVYNKIEEEVDKNTIITSNTSAIPISSLQKIVEVPERLLGLHWHEPAHTTRFMEIIGGGQTKSEYMEWLYELSHLWGKEPILVKKDIRGFITNRLMYSMYKEAMYLVENGYATIEDIDKSCRNNAGYYMTLVGIFRWMDLTGVSAYHNVMKDLLPTLNKDSEVPKLIEDVVKNGGNGISNAKGFYDYTVEEAEMWEKTYEEFAYEIRKLALRYPSDIVQQKLAKKKE